MNARTAFYDITQQFLDVIESKFFFSIISLLIYRVQWSVRWSIEAGLGWNVKWMTKVKKKSNKPNLTEEE